MLKGIGVVLKGGMQVGHGKVPRIARIGKEAQVGNLELFDEFTLFLERRQCGRLPVRASFSRWPPTRGTRTTTSGSLSQYRILTASLR